MNECRGGVSAGRLNWHFYVYTRITRWPPDRYIKNNSDKYILQPHGARHEPSKYISTVEGFIRKITEMSSGWQVGGEGRPLEDGSLLV